MSKIIIVLHDLRGGGAEKMMVRLANQLAIMGDEVELVMLTEGGVNKQFVSPAVTLVELKGTRTATSMLALRRHLKQSEADAILSVLTHVNVICALVCASLDLLDILTVSERNTFSLDKKVNNSRLIKAAYFLAPMIYRWLPNPVVAVSQGVADDLCAQPFVREQDVTTAPNPVITEAMMQASQSPATHPWLVDKSTPVVVSVGRLSHQKGFDMLLDAFAEIPSDPALSSSPPLSGARLSSPRLSSPRLGIPRPSGPPPSGARAGAPRLIIFGEGELREQFQQQIERLGLSERVDLAGYTDNPLAEIRNADLYVLSSRFEGSPNGLVEAMSLGIPVIAFDCPHGPQEILRAGEVAPLIEYQNVEKLSQAMQQALTTPVDAQGRYRISQAVDHFHAANSARHYRDVMGVA